MRVVGAGSKVWRTVGVGSGDAAALCNCAPSPDENVLTLWAELVSKRELKELKQMRKCQLDQGTDDWLKWRKAGLGGSEVGCVVGANPYRGSQAPDIWGQKLPEEHPNYLPPKASNPAMKRGQALEPEARRRYESLMGWSATPICCVHDLHDHVRASLDGWNDDTRVSLEIKASGERNHRLYLQCGRITDPIERQTRFAELCPSYRYQVLYQMLITDAKCCHFVGWNPDMPDPADQLVLFDLYREPEEEKRLLDRVNEFWEMVVNRTSPPPDWLEPCWRLPTRVEVA